MLIKAVAVCFFVVLIACGPSKKAKHQQMIADAAYDSTVGSEAITKSDCFTCHTISEKLIGPSFIDIAVKYEPTDANITKLTDKIINGGFGPWGNTPMTPHPRLSKAAAEAMVKYILLLKK